MYIVCNTEQLENFEFKEYRSGYSKKIKDGFLDISFMDLIVKKVHFENDAFVYELEDGTNIRDLIKKGIVKRNEEKT